MLKRLPGVLLLCAAAGTGVAADPASIKVGILLPLTLGPAWLRAIARWNPFSWSVDAARALFAGDPGDPHVWKALVIVTVLAAVASVWSARRFATSVR